MATALQTDRVGDDAPPPRRRAERGVVPIRPAPVGIDYTCVTVRAHANGGLRPGLYEYDATIERETSSMNARDTSDARNPDAFAVVIEGDGIHSEEAPGGVSFYAESLEAIETLMRALAGALDMAEGMRATFTAPVRRLGGVGAEVAP